MGSEDTKVSRLIHAMRFDEAADEWRRRMATTGMPPSSPYEFETTADCNLPKCVHSDEYSDYVLEYGSVCAETRGLQAIERLALIHQAKRFEEVPDILDVVPEIGEYQPEPRHEMYASKFKSSVEDRPRFWQVEENTRVAGSECHLPQSIAVQCRFFESAQICLIRQREMSTALCPMASPVAIPVCFCRIVR